MVSARLARMSAAAAAHEAAAAPGPAEAVAALLSCHSLERAAAAAASSGDVRLAALLATAGSRGIPRAALAEQLAEWAASGALSAGLIAAPRLQAYRIAAGRVLDALRDWPRWDGPSGASGVVPWRRALGMHLWYATDAAAPLSAAVEAFESSVIDLGPAWHPFPAYAEPFSELSDAEDGGQDAAEGTADAARMASSARVRRVYDMGYEALRLATGCTPAARGGVTPAARVLRPAACSPDRTDYVMSWCAWGVLGSAGLLPSDGGRWEATQVWRGVVSQLESAGMAPWAIYAATHMPWDAQLRDLVLEVKSCAVVSQRNLFVACLPFPTRVLRIAGPGLPPSLSSCPPPCGSFHAIHITDGDFPGEPCNLLCHLPPKKDIVAMSLQTNISSKRASIRHPSAQCDV